MLLVRIYFLFSNFLFSEENSMFKRNCDKNSKYMLFNVVFIISFSIIYVFKLTWELSFLIFFSFWIIDSMKRSTIFHLHGSIIINLKSIESMHLGCYYLHISFWIDNNFQNMALFWRFSSSTYTRIWIRIVKSVHNVMKTKYYISKNEMDGQPKTIRTRKMILIFQKMKR